MKETYRRGNKLYTAEPLDKRGGCPVCVFSPNGFSCNQALIDKLKLPDCVFYRDPSNRVYYTVTIIKDKSHYNTIQRKFRKFLADHDIIVEYYRLCNDNAYGSTNKFLNHARPKNYVDGGFVWKGDIKFWSDLNREWLRELNNAPVPH